MTEEMVNKFDYEEGLLYFVVEEARRRSRIAGWVDPLSGCSIQVGHATYSVLTEYGKLSMDDITMCARRADRCMSKASKSKHAKNNITGFISREGKSDDFIVNLFCGCLAANDYIVSQCIERLLEIYKEGEDLDHTNLMKLALWSTKEKARMGGTIQR
eukprot:14026059-Ditylum_brightwellii.AAC.1